MQTVKHRLFGVGEVINREDKENGTYITVRFENGKELRCDIPNSFMNDIMVAEGSLKAEIEAAIAQKKARNRARIEAFKEESAAAIKASSGRKRMSTKNPIETAFRQYLIKLGYSERSEAGNPTTVYAYVRSIKKVLKEEGHSWHTLQREIDNIIPVYDVGGAKQCLGDESKRTVIDSLKRYQEFVNP